MHLFIPEMFQTAGIPTTLRCFFFSWSTYPGLAVRSILRQKHMQKLPYELLRIETNHEPKRHAWCHFLCPFPHSELVLLVGNCEPATRIGRSYVFCPTHPNQALSRFILFCLLFLGCFVHHSLFVVSHFVCFIYFFLFVL